MKYNSVFKALAITETTSNVFDSLNPVVFCCKHAIIYLQPDGIQDTPEIVTNHFTDRNHRVKATVTDPIRQPFPIFFSYAHILIIPQHRSRFLDSPGTSSFQIHASQTKKLFTPGCAIISSFGILQPLESRTSE
jgi:hypothetical protein